MKVFKHIFATIIVSFNFSAFASENLVTPENYARAETDEAWRKIFEEVGSNTFRHDRGLVPIDKQPAVTMNRDTVYSLGIFYAPIGTTVTLPKSTDGRYQSAMIMQNDDYTDQVFYAPGTFKIESETEFVLVIIRTQINPSDPSDTKNVKITLKSGGIYSSNYIDLEEIRSRDGTYYKTPKNVIFELKFPNLDIKGVIR